MNDYAPYSLKRTGLISALLSLCLLTTSLNTYASNCVKVGEVCTQYEGDECVYFEDEYECITDQLEPGLSCHGSELDDFCETLESASNNKDSSLLKCSKPFKANNLTLIKEGRTPEVSLPTFFAPTGCRILSSECIDSEGRHWRDPLTHETTFLTPSCWRMRYELACSVKPDSNQQCNRLVNQGCTLSSTPICTQRDISGKCVEQTSEWICPKDSAVTDQEAGTTITGEIEVPTGQTIYDDKSCLQLEMHLHNLGYRCQKSEHTNATGNLVYRYDCEKVPDQVAKKTMDEFVALNRCQPDLVNSGTYTCWKAKEDNPLSWPNGSEVLESYTVPNYREVDTCNNVNDLFCKALTEKCIVSGGTRFINGRPKTQGCFGKRYTYQCNQRQNQDCDALEKDEHCQFVEKTCPKDDPNCTRPVSHYVCSSPVPSMTIGNACDDQVCINGICHDIQKRSGTELFSSVVQLEIARQASIYADQDNMTFFNGQVLRCKNRAGVTSCCKAKVSTQSSNAALGRALTFGYGITKEIVRYVGSPYVYDALMWSPKTEKILHWMYGDAPNGMYSPSFSYWGLTLKYVPNQGFSFNFSPSNFVFSAATEAYGKWAGCSYEDQRLAIAKSRGLCTYIGEECTSKLSGFGCVETQEVYVCYNSKLARILNEQGRRQLGKPIGTVDDINPKGFSYQELSLLDFQSIDFTEFINDIVENIKTSSTESIQNIEARAMERIEKMIRGELSRRAPLDRPSIVGAQP